MSDVKNWKMLFIQEVFFLKEGLIRKLWCSFERNEDVYVQTANVGLLDILNCWGFPMYFPLWELLGKGFQCVFSGSLNPNLEDHPS